MPAQRSKVNDESNTNVVKTAEKGERRRKEGTRQRERERERERENGNRRFPGAI